MENMSEHMIETELIKNEYDEFKRNEDNIHRELDGDRFYQILEDVYGYTYETISKYIEGGVYTFNEQHEFNIVLRKMKRQHNIGISDSILFMEDTISLNHIMKFIDDETERTLKCEMSDKYSIEEEISNLLKFCVDFSDTK